jgi:hypothetical protein
MMLCGIGCLALKLEVSRAMLKIKSDISLLLAPDSTDWLKDFS